MKLIKILIIFFIAFNTLESAYPKYQIGVGFSTLSGAGISFQYELNNSNTFLFKGIPAYYNNNPPSDIKYFYIVGGEYQYNLFKKKLSNNIKHRSFLLVGGSFWHLKDTWVKREYMNDREIVFRYERFNDIYNIGFGIGYELTIANNISLMLQINYQYQKSDDTYFDKLFDLSPNSTEYNGLGFGIGIKFIL